VELDSGALVGVDQVRTLGDGQDRRRIGIETHSQEDTVGTITALVGKIVPMGNARVEGTEMQKSMQSLDLVEVSAAEAEGTTHHPVGITTVVRMGTVVVEGMIGQVETGGIATGMAGTTEIGVTGMAVGPVVAAVMGTAVVADTRLSLAVRALQYIPLCCNYQGLLLPDPLAILELRTRTCSLVREQTNS
jgi:hypothetical protein